MAQEVRHVHDYALDGDEGWEVGDRVDDEEGSWRIIERDDDLGYWYFEEVGPEDEDQQ